MKPSKTNFSIRRYKNHAMCSTCSTCSRPKTQNKTGGFVRIRDLEGAEGGTSWNERRDGCSEMGSIWLSEVQRSTGAIADPGKSPTAAGLETWVDGAGTPKIVNN